MKYVVDLIFLYELKDIKNKNIEKNLIQVREDIKKYINQANFSKQFIDEFISMYDSEQLDRIIKIIRKEIYKRARNEINNEI